MRVSDKRSRFDLHLHTSLSDGRYPPEEVLRQCAANGLDVVSITDHDLGGAVAPGEHRVDGRRVQVLAGAEVSGMHQGREHHLLVYFPESVPEAFVGFCKEQCRNRAVRYELAVRNLGLGDLPPVDDEARAGARSLTRLHIARGMVERGHATNIGDAFARFLGEGHGLVPPLEYPMVEAIRMARACGGITSWAHPAKNDVEQLLGTFVAAGLQGLEGLRPQLTSADRRFYRQAARRHGLFLTGGSDWHGWRGEELGLFALETHELTDFVDVLAAA